MDNIKAPQGTEHPSDEVHIADPKKQEDSKSPTYPFYHGEQPQPAQLLELPKQQPPKVVITDPTGAPASEPSQEKKEKKDKKKGSTAEEKAKLDENWKFINEKEKDLNERLKELESQKFILEQARGEKKAIAEEVEQMKREVQSLKKVKEKLFLEVQRIKVPPNQPKIVMVESQIQTEIAPGFENFDQILKKIQHLEGRCEELQDVNFTKSEQLKEALSKVNQLEDAQKKATQMVETVKNKENQIKGHQNEIDKLQGMLDDLHKQSSSVKTFTQAQLQEFEANLQTKISYIKTLESQVEIQESEIKNLKGKSTGLEKERNKFKGMCTDLTHKLEDLTVQLQDKEKQAVVTQPQKTPSQLDLSLSKNKNNSQLDRKNESKTNVHEDTQKNVKIPIHTANFGGQLLNQDSIEDLDDTKKKQNPNPLDVTFKPDSSLAMTLKKLIETQQPILPKDEQVADLENQLKLQTIKADNALEQMNYQRTQLTLKVAEFEKVTKDCQKMKTIIDDQMQIAEKQREKILKYKEQEATFQSEIKSMNRKIHLAEEKERLQEFQIDKLRKQLKKYDRIQDDNKQIKDLQEQVKKMKNENELLNELIKSLKIQVSAKVKRNGGINAGADFTIDQMSGGGDMQHLPDIHAKYPQGSILNNDQSKVSFEPGLPSHSILLNATPQYQKGSHPMADPSRQHQRSSSVTYNFEEEDETNTNKLRMKRQQSRERRERIFTDQMDIQMNQYNEKIRNRFMHQSPGVKGVFSTNFKPNYNVSSNAGSQAYVGMMPNASPGMHSDRSTLSRGNNSFKSPSILGVKMDRINNRLVINDDKILSLLQAPMME